MLFFFRAWPSNNLSDKGEQDLPKVPVEQQLREIDSTTNINLEDLHKSVENFKAGQVKHHLPLWESLTNDLIILDAIKHHHIEFEVGFPKQMARPNKIHFSPMEINIIDAEIAKLVSKEILTLVNHTPDSFISNIFIRPKKDGTHRMILNLKPLNEFVDYHHFKMDTFRTTLKLI